ncbi:hypothetical protein SDJN02_13602, partial [Cucurbita argyrosperma subsp. argyrosperma]
MKRLTFEELQEHDGEKTMSPSTTTNGMDTCSGQKAIQSVQEQEHDGGKCCTDEVGAASETHIHEGNESLEVEVVGTERETFSLQKERAGMGFVQWSVG